MPKADGAHIGVRHPHDELRAVQDRAWSCLEVLEGYISAPAAPASAGPDLSGRGAETAWPEEVAEALNALGRLERYRTPRYRAWLRACLQGAKEQLALKTPMPDKRHRSALGPDAEPE